MITEDKKGYWKGGEGGRTRLTDFTITRPFVYIGNDGKRVFHVNVFAADGGKFSDIKMRGVDSSSTKNFRCWLADFTDLHFMGTADDLNRIMMYLSDQPKASEIYELDYVGRVNGFGKRVWVGTTGAYINGHYKRPQDGVIKISDVKHIKGADSFEYKLPEDPWTVKQILEQLLVVYPPQWAWMLLGMATAMYYHDEIRRMWTTFPVFCAYGPTRQGKTKFAEIMASMLGGGKASSASAGSTKAGMSRMLSSLRSVPVIHNEVRVGNNSKDAELIRKVFDGDKDYSGRKTNDDQVWAREVNTSMMLTTEHPPTEQSLINRMASVNFYEFNKDTDLEVNDFFHDFHTEGVIDNNNAGWLKALTGVSNPESLREDIKYFNKKFYMADRTADERSRMCLATVFGCLHNASECLNIAEILLEIRMERKNKTDLLSRMLYDRAVMPEGQDLTKYFSSYWQESSELVSDEDKIREFLQQLYNFSKDDPSSFNAHCDVITIRDVEWLRIVLAEIFPKIQGIDGRRSQRLRDVALAHIKKGLNFHFDSCAKTTRLPGNPKARSAYWIRVEDIHEMYEIKFYPTEMEREKAEAAVIEVEAEEIEETVEEEVTPRKQRVYVSDGRKTP